MTPRIAIVRVAMGGGQARDALEPPIFAILGALTSPSAAQLTFFDERRRPLPERIDADWVCLSVETFAAAHAYDLADHYRSRGHKVGLGGIHPTLLPEEARTHADVVFVGDAEGVWPAFLADLTQGTVKPRYVDDGEAWFVDTSHQPPATGYPPLGVVQLSRGCRYACDFCSIKALYPGRVRCKSVDAAVRELQHNPHRRVFIADDNLFADRAWARDLFTAMVPLRKKWACQVSLDIAQDDAMLALMKKAGCFLVLIGIESLNPDTLRAMRKRANDVRDYDRAIEAIYRHGLMVYATFVIGYDTDTPTTADEILAFARSHSFAVANFNPLSVYPGTRLYRRLSDEGRLIQPRWWLDRDYRYGQLAHSPEGASAHAIEAGCRRARYSFYSPLSILRRLFRAPNWRTPLVYLAINLVSAREIRRKQDQILGTPERSQT
ncbi:MAG: B12-binding domain-containing radical SAM protein [Micrococcales bacterium]|nr:B12-binding domain-containing radical SAM protein [Micrococcales bacterium]